MPDLILRENAITLPVPPSIHLNGVASLTGTPAVASDILWRWEDDPEMEPQLLGSVVAGHTLSVPFDLQGRTIRLFATSRTEDGKEARPAVEQADQVVFVAPYPPTLANAVRSGANTVLTIANNGGTGTIRILRSLNGSAFGEIGNVPYNSTGYTDSTATINGTYVYKLIQDGQAGESNTKTITVTGSAGTGSAPSNLTASYNSGTGEATLNWTNNGGTGSNIVERRLVQGGGPYFEIATLAAASTTFTDVPERGYTNFTYFYRVRNTSAAGYSNEADIYVEALNEPY
jgi:hypothetical protein